jgi:hypothetical protein
MNLLTRGHRVKVVLVAPAIFGFVAITLLIFTMAVCQSPFEGKVEIRFCQNVFSLGTLIVLSMITFGGTIAYFCVHYGKIPGDSTFYHIIFVFAVLIIAAAIGSFGFSLVD